MSLKADGAVRWWHDVTPDPSSGHSGDRGALARLRRCATVAEAMREPATFDLFRRCEGSGHRDLPSAALTASVLAHVRDDDRNNRSIGRRIGYRAPDEKEKTLMSPLRFRRLMEAETDDEKLTAFRRLVALASGTLNVRNLAEALLFWTDERRGEELKRRWVYDYWNADVRTTTATDVKETTP